MLPIADSFFEMPVLLAQKISNAYQNAYNRQSVTIKVIEGDEVAEAAERLWSGTYGPEFGIGPDSPLTSRVKEPTDGLGTAIIYSVHPDLIDSLAQTRGDDAPVRDHHLQVSDRWNRIKSKALIDLITRHVNDDQYELVIKSPLLARRAFDLCFGKEPILNLLAPYGSSNEYRFGINQVAKVLVSSR